LSLKFTLTLSATVSISPITCHRIMINLLSIVYQVVSVACRERFQHFLLTNCHRGDM